MICIATQSLWVLTHIVAQFADFIQAQIATQQLESDKVWPFPFEY